MVPEAMGPAGGDEAGEQHHPRKRQHRGHQLCDRRPRPTEEGGVAGAPLRGVWLHLPANPILT